MPIKITGAQIRNMPGQSSERQAIAVEKSPATLEKETSLSCRTSADWRHSPAPGSERSGEDLDDGNRRGWHEPCRREVTPQAELRTGGGAGLRRGCGFGRGPYPAGGTGSLLQEGIEAGCVQVGKDDSIDHRRKLRAGCRGKVQGREDPGRNCLRVRLPAGL